MSLIGLCETFDPFDSFNGRAELLRQHGFVRGGDNRQYNKEAVTEVLQELCVGEVSEEKQILWWEQDGDEETIFLAYPVMMSLLLEEYDCMKKLLELGYAAEGNNIKNQIYATNVGKRDKNFIYENISLQQLLLAREFPVEILGVVLASANAKSNFFEFDKDYWKNPLLVEDINAGIRKRIPALDGMKHIHKHFPKYLKGFINNRFAREWQHDITRMEARPRHQLFETMLEILKGNVKELGVLLEAFCPTFYYNKFANEQREMDYWLKKLPEIYKACEGKAKCESLYFELLVGLLYEMIDAGVTYEKGKHKERYEQLKNAIIAGKPAHYTPEDFLNFIYNKKKNLSRQNAKCTWTEYLRIWKYVIKEPIVVARNSNELWRFLRELFRTDDEDDFLDVYEEDEEEFEEESLMSYIFLLEEIDTRIAEDERDGEYKELLVELVCGLMQLESEEAVLACLKNKLIPKEQIKACINTALKFERLRIVPALIMAQE